MLAMPLTFSSILHQVIWKLTSLKWYAIRLKVRNGKKQLAHPFYNSDLIDYDYMVMTVSRIVFKKVSQTSFQTGAFGSLSNWLESPLPPWSIASPDKHQFVNTTQSRKTALQNTKSPWEFNAYVAPIKIVNPSDVELPNFTDCQTSGYGYTQE